MDSTMRYAGQKLKSLKKSKTTLPVQNAHKKKIKTAFSLTTNSVQTMQNLRATNRSLALKLGKIRQDFDHVHKRYTQLLEQNHELRREVLELKKPGRLMELEVNKRYMEQMGFVKKKICVLNSLASGFAETLAELSEICFLKNPLGAIPVSNMTKSCASPPTEKWFASADMSLNDDACSASVQTSNLHEDFNTFLRKIQPFEMKLKREKSFICSSEDENNTASRSTSPDSLFENKQNLLSKLHVNFLKRFEEPEKRNCKYMKKDAAKFNQRMDMDEEVQRQETFILTSDGFPNNGVISDIAVPQLLGDNYGDETEWLDSDTENPLQFFYDSAPLLNSSSMEMKKRKQCLQKKNRLKQTSVTPREELSQLTFESSGKQIPIKRYPSLQNRIALTKKKESSLDTGTKKFNKCVTKAGVKNLDLITPSEFSLASDNKQNLVKSGNKASYITIIQRCLPSHAVEKHTVFTADSLELPACVENNLTQHVGLSRKASTSDNINIRDKIEYFSKYRSQKNNEQKEETICETPEAKVPDSTSTRLSRPEQCVQAAPRKESDRICKSDPVTHPKSASRSKKLKTGTVMNLLQRKPHTGFYFKDESPVFSHTVKRKIDGSSLSPPLFLSKNRSHSRNTKETLASVEMSSAETSHMQSPSLKKKTILLNKDFTYKVLHKDSPLVITQSDYQTRSRSHDSKQSDCENSTEKIRKNTQSGMKWIQPMARSPANVKIDCDLKSAESSQAHSIDRSSLESVKQRSGSLCSKELAGKEDSSEWLMTNSLVHLDTMCKHGKLNNMEVEEGSNSVMVKNKAVSVKEKAASSDNRDLKSLTKMPCLGKKKEQNADSQKLFSRDRSSKKSGVLSHSVPAVELEIENLDEETITKDSFSSLDSDAEHLTRSQEIKKLLKKIKYHSFSITSSLSDTNLLSSATTLKDVDACSESVFLALKLSCDRSEGSTTITERSNANRNESKSSVLLVTEKLLNTPFRVKTTARSRSVARKTMEMTLDMTSGSAINEGDSDNFLKYRNFTAKRIEKVGWIKGGRKESDIRNTYACTETPENDVAYDDYAGKTRHAEDLCEGATINHLILSGYRPVKLLQRLRRFRRLALSCSDESIHFKTNLNGGSYDSPGTGHHSQMSKNINVLPVSFLQFPNSSLSPSKKLASRGGLERKLRVDTPTSLESTSDTIDFFKSPIMLAEKQEDQKTF